MTQDNLEGQMTIFNFLPEEKERQALPEKPERYNIVLFFDDEWNIQRGIVIDPYIGKKGILVTTAGNRKVELSDWYDTREKAEESRKGKNGTF